MIKIDYFGFWDVHNKMTFFSQIIIGYQSQRRARSISAGFYLKSL